MEIKSLVLLDGPSKFRESTVRVTGTTMDDMKTPSGLWIFYDRRSTGIDVISVTESGVFVASEREIMFGVNEVSRHPFKGVL